MCLRDRDEAVPIRSCGLYRRENAGMSSERKVRILPAEYLRFPEDVYKRQHKRRCGRRRI